MDSLRSLPRYNWMTSFLTSQGWEKMDEGHLGSLWRVPGRHEENDAFVLPRAMERDAGLAESVLTRVASVNGTPLARTLELVTFGRADVIDLRVTGESVGSGWIPFGSASAVVRKIRDAFRASATTAFGIKSDLRGNYSNLGDAVLDGAQMAHTRDGSFIFPVMVRLPEPDVLPDNAGELPYERVFAESNERRVTRTFAEAVSAITRVVADKEPTEIRGSDVSNVVPAGVSRQLCVALAELMSDKHIETVSTTFNWAPDGPKSESLPISLELKSSQAAGFTRAAEVLRQQVSPTVDLYSGRIVQMSVDEDVHHLTLQTVRQRRQSRIQIRVSKREHDEAAPWYLEGRTVLAEGALRRGGGSWFMDRPARLDLLENLYLP